MMQPGDLQILIVKVILVAVWLALIAALTIWKIRHGAPQDVWWYCEILGWCRP